jgi:hypothetical protein
MRCLTRGMLFAAALALMPSVASAAEPTSTTVVVTGPSFPTPFQSAVVGLALTAIVVIGARATQRTPGTMMYMVLATVSLTGVLIAASHRIHTNFDDAAQQTLNHLQQAAGR